MRAHPGGGAARPDVDGVAPVAVSSQSPERTFLRRLTIAAGLAFVALAPSPLFALPANFTESTAFSGLTRPVAVKFSPDGRVFVAEKSGIIKVFDNLADTTATTVADLRMNVHDFWDRGLLGFALDPQFPTRPYIYVLYTYDFDPLEPSIPAPRWGDTCPDKNGQNQPIGPGANTDGCVANGRLSRLKVNPNNTLDGGEQVLLENNWCQQFPSHSVGSLVFGPEGALYVSAGDGASFNTEDWGQMGGTQGSAPYNYPFTPVNPCADPNGARGTAATKPAAEGGALRSQDVRTLADTVSFDGSVLRVDPDTGAPWPDNPLIGGTSSADDRIIAHGLRNPFRMTRRPGTSEVWIGDVGWNTWEEINRIVSPNDSTVENFGWPCVEGPDRPVGYNTNLTLCTSLPTASTTAPHYSFRNGQTVYNGDPCTIADGSSISGLAFYASGTYPAGYSDTLFFADHTRNCVYKMTAGTDGLPDPATRTVFLSSATNAQQIGNPLPVDLEIGPGGDLFITDHEGGRIRRIRYNVGNNPPTAVIQATPSNGPIPLVVAFNGTGSTDPDPGATLFYAWDLDGDGQYDDSTLPQPSWTYTAIGNVTVRLQVTDDDGATATTQTIISAGDSAPVATLVSPTTALNWHVGETIPFSGTGYDTTDGPLAPAAMRWDIILRHCVSGPGTCHEHAVETFNGIDQGFYTAPDHEYYSELEIRLTVTDSGGLADMKSVILAPEVVTNDFATSPAGLTLAVAGADGMAPFSRPAIVGSTVSLVAPSPQSLAGAGYYFVSWNDGGDAGRAFTAAATPLAFHANFAACVAVETICDGLDNDCEGVVDDVAVPPGTFTLAIDSAAITWTAAPGAQAYDVVRGRITTPGVSPFSAATTDACVAPATASTSVPFTTDPPTGEAWWFVARGRNCGGAGTWDSGSPSQTGSRDAGINAAPLTCP